MPPLDASLYGQFGPRLKSVAEYDAEASAAEANKIQMLMQRQQYGQAQQGIADENALRQAYKTGLSSDPQAAFNQLAQINPRAAYAHQKSLLDAEKERAGISKTKGEAEKERLANGLKRFEITGQVMQDVTDQATYDVARAQLEATFPDLAGRMPQVYNAAEIEANKKRAMSVKEGLENEWKRLGYNLQVSTQAQKTRNDVMIPDGNGGSMVNTPYVEAEAGMRRAGASSVNVVNAGQKGYENESKLRNDFKSEPIYKDHADLTQSYKQIKAGLKSETPIGDVAAATKMMKLLDPGSVVRESELAIAMAAAGKLDRLQNYLQMKISGQTLTPTQRKDFGSLADEIMAASTQGYNAKRGEYEQFGKTYELNPAVLGPPAAAIAGPAKRVKFSDLP